MSKFQNLSNGQSDGVVIFYMKNGKLHPVALTKDQAQMLDIAISVPFKSSAMNVIGSPVSYQNISHMLDK